MRFVCEHDTRAGERKQARGGGAYLPERVIVADGLDDLAHEPMLVGLGDRVDERRCDALVYCVLELCCTSVLLEGTLWTSILERQLTK